MSTIISTYGFGRAQNDVLFRCITNRLQDSGFHGCHQAVQWSLRFSQPLLETLLGYFYTEQCKMLTL